MLESIVNTDKDRQTELIVCQVKMEDVK